MAALLFNKALRASAAVARAKLLAVGFIIESFFESRAGRVAAVVLGFASGLVFALFRAVPKCERATKRFGRISFAGCVMGLEEAWRRLHHPFVWLDVAVAVAVDEAPTSPWAPRASA